MGTLTASIEEHTTAIDTLNKEITEMQLQIKRRGEDRELENRDFQATVADQKETQQLLHKAHSVLKAVYKQQEVHSQTFLQQDPAPAGFSDYGANRGSGGVVAMIEKIIADAAALEKETVRDEQTAQSQYEAFVKDTNGSIAAKQASIVNQQAAKAQAEQDLLTTKEDLKNKQLELDTLANTAKALDLDCSFVMRNF